MSCYNPIPVNLYTSPTGQRSVIFEPRTFVFGVVRDLENGGTSRSIYLPCGKCAGCLAARARDWSIRCMQEARKYDENCFVTLTYDPEHLPADNSLHKDHLQKFIKRLRKRFGKIRYFACGEYGDHGQRPHYHLILFGIDFNKSVKSRKVEFSASFYMSEELAKLWPFGYSSVGRCTYASCCYCAQYCSKKIGKEVLAGRTPEFIVMSTHPGIGRDYAEDYRLAIYDNGFLVAQGQKYRIPRYYRKVAAQIDPDRELMESVKRMDCAEIPDFEELQRKWDCFMYRQSLKRQRKI